MLSESQRLEKLEKIKRCVEIYLQGDKTILDVSKETGYTTSSIQRYLNDSEYIMELYPIEYKSIILKIKSKLLKNKIDAKSKGGISFAENNVALKDEYGHFTGSRKK